jgi:Zn-dependent protease with chaperone function
MSLVQWLAQPEARLFTAALLHFVWQGFSIALLLAAIVELGGFRQAGARHACSLLALLGMLLCPLVTFAWLVLAAHGDDSRQLPLIIAGSPAAALPFGWEVPSWAVWFRSAQPYALAIWLGGVILFGARLLSGAITTARLRRDRLALPKALAATVEKLAARLEIEAASLVWLGRHVTDAMAVGVLKPLILIPASWATEMPPEVLEAVIAHELAHLRRHDLWINLLQRIVEALLFYHPAVWWLSRRLRLERELCCDELAVTITGRRQVYVEALETVARQRAALVEHALAAGIRGEKSMRLLQRVRYVLGLSVKADSFRLWPAGLIALLLPLAMWTASLGLFGPVSARALADDDRDDRVILLDDRDEDGDDEKIVRLRVRKERDEGDDDDEAKEKDKVKKPVPKKQILKKPGSEDAPRLEEKRDVILRFSHDGDPQPRRVPLAELEDVIGKKIVGADGKPHLVVERRTVRKGDDGEVIEEIETRLDGPDGRPVRRVEAYATAKREGGDNRLEELTVLVKKLTAQVQDLQKEVAQLRGDRAPVKRSPEREEEARRAWRITGERELEEQKRALKLDAEKIQMAAKALAEKEAALAKQGKWIADDVKEAVREKMERAKVEMERAMAEKERAIAEKARADAEGALRKRQREREEREQRDRRDGARP